MSSNTSNNKNTKNMEEIQTAMQALIAQGRKEWNAAGFRAERPAGKAGPGSRRRSRKFMTGWTP